MYSRHCLLAIRVYFKTWVHYWSSLQLLLQHPCFFLKHTCVLKNNNNINGPCLLVYKKPILGTYTIKCALLSVSRNTSLTILLLCNIVKLASLHLQVEKTSLQLEDFDSKLEDLVMLKMALLTAQFLLARIHILSSLDIMTRVFCVYKKHLVDMGIEPKPLQQGFWQ